MSEQRILAAAMQRDAFEVIDRDLPRTALTPQGAKFLELVGQLYARSDAVDRIDLETFTDWLDAVMENPKHRADFAKLAGGLPDVPAMAVAVLVNEQRAKALRLKLAEALATGTPYSELLTELQRVESPLRDDDEPLLDLTDQDEFMADVSSTSLESRIRLWPKALHARTDGASPGHHICFFGRPGIGKSLMAINSTAGHLFDRHRVLYIGNEDPISSIRRRIYVRLARTDYARFEADPKAHHQKLVESGIGGLNAFRLTPGSAREIDVLIRRTSPNILVIDQLRNMHAGESGSSGAARIDAAAQEVRNLLGKYSLVGYSLTQAGAGEHGKNDYKAFLGKADIDQSKTGLPGATDLLAGIGCTPNMLAAHQRGISLLKNKLKGECEGDQFYVTYVESENRVE